MTTLRAYARAFATDNYDALWALLTPTARAVWSGPAAYASFLRLKFAPVKLLDTSLGAPVQDGVALRVPLTLDLAWRAGNGPPGVLALLRNLPVRLVPTRDGWRVDGGGPLDPEAPVIPPTTLPARGLRVPILMYHHVSNLPPLAQSQVGLTVKTSDFAAQLAYLAGHGYHTVRLVDLFDALYYRRALPSRPVILTFDDGYADNYTDAFPLLRRDHMVGVFNIITNFPGRTVGVNSYMTWARIEAMAAAGMEMESHTAAHQDLGLINKGEAEYELDASRAALTAHIHRAVQVLCYPSGEPFRSGPAAARTRILGLLPHFGYVGALLDPVTPGTLQDARAPYELPRVRVSNDEPLTAFVASLGA